MAIQKFEDIIAWQKAQDYAVEIYSEFRKINDFAFKDQINRSVIPISNNIAEGFDRSSKADFKRFLYIALGSCSEVKSMIYLAYRLQYLKADQRSNLIHYGEEISKIIRGLIKSMNS